MRKAENTIVFGSHSGKSQPRLTPVPPSKQLTPVAFPAPELVTRSAHPTPAFFDAPTSVPTRRLADDLVDDRSYMRRPERGLAFAAVSLALVGIAAAGTYFFLGSRTPVISSTTTTSAEVTPATSQVTPTPTPTPAPTATTAMDQAPAPPASAPPTVDAVRAPGITKPREIPGTQLMPTERPQATNQAPATTQAARRVPSKQPPAGMSDEALERAGYYKNLFPSVAPSQIAPTPPVQTANAGEPKAPNAASTEEPSQFAPQSQPGEGTPKTPNAASTDEPRQFTPQPNQVLPDVKIKE